MGDKLYFAPLDEHPPRRILDIATGTGDWAIAMGDRFPNAIVTATDLSPIQPEVVPTNVEFYVEDSCVSLPSSPSITLVFEYKRLVIEEQYRSSNANYLCLMWP